MLTMIILPIVLLILFVIIFIQAVDLANNVFAVVGVFGAIGSLAWSIAGIVLLYMGKL